MSQSRRKRILVLSNMYPGPKQATFGIFVKNQVEALRNRGMDVDVVAVDDPSMERKHVLMKYSNWAWKTFSAFVRKGRKYDVVHAHYVFPTGMLALLFKKVLGTRLVVTAHGGDIERMAKKNERIRKWTKRILQEADEVIAVGHELQQTIIHDFGVEEKRVSILNMGVNRSVFKPYPKEEVRQSLGIPNGVRPILFIGNLIPEKGVEELLAAFKELKMQDDQLQLYLIGNPKKQLYKEKLEALVRDQEIKGVFFKEALPQQEIAKWMSAADLFVLPSYLEGFGLVALEAMACGTPVVGTKVGGLRYLLTDGHGVLVEPKQMESLRDGMEQVLSHKESANLLVERGFARAEEFDQERIIDRLLELYQTEEER